ncbi:hypothetical protein CANCADRAFT_58020 [Tortispora caseinolytica NRRL Y-17796]|uniref:Thioredoxin domain-containing protein n=1 Tax=Tortispora caseinolytica NRRL Y-17796 TaxID=767744 RepID=A0A1E4TB15_9ASCO|nr:hypothetical protein CANCADRAFT_58020 [Tortispora caseinolytica NRRL Y-17796]
MQAARFAVRRSVAGLRAGGCGSCSGAMLRRVPIKQEPIRIGSTAPDFKAQTSKGPISFHEFIGNDWVVFFSHPADYTPVCTTELGAFAKLQPEFEKRGAKLIGLSANGLRDHEGWIKDIEEVSSEGAKVGYPIIADEDRKVSWLYGMLDEESVKNIDSNPIPVSLRSVFIIDPNKKVRIIITYPPAVGRNTAEVLRALEALQLADKAGVATPVNWTPGGDVIVPVPVSDADAEAKFGSVRKVKPYLRYNN